MKKEKVKDFNEFEDLKAADLLQTSGVTQEPEPEWPCSTCKAEKQDCEHCKASDEYNKFFERKQERETLDARIAEDGSIEIHSLQTSGVDAGYKKYQDFLHDTENDRITHHGGTGGNVKKIEALTENVIKELFNNRQSFISIGYYLYQIYSERIGDICKLNIDIDHYVHDFYEAFLVYCEKKFGYKKSTLFNLIGCAVRYGERDEKGNLTGKLDSKYERYGYSQLVELLPLPELLPPELTIKEIRQRKKELFGQSSENKEKLKAAEINTPAVQSKKSEVYGRLDFTNFARNDLLSLVFDILQKTTDMFIHGFVADKVDAFNKSLGCENNTGCPCDDLIDPCDDEKRKYCFSNGAKGCKDYLAWASSRGAH